MSNAPAPAYRLSGTTALHRGDRAYQQDQVALLAHARTPGVVLGVLADGMGGKSGGRKAADQVMLTARQLFERFVPGEDDPAELLRQLLMDAHLTIKLTAIATEQEPHSTLAAFLVLADRSCRIVHAGDSRVYHFRRAALLCRTVDDSFVQRLIDEGQISVEQAQTHPQSNLLTGCLGTPDDPPLSIATIDRLEVGDSLLACSDGLWHYFEDEELGRVIDALPPREAGEMLMQQARQRARGGGDNLSLALLRIDAVPKAG